MVVSGLVSGPGIYGGRQGSTNGVSRGGTLENLAKSVFDGYSSPCSFYYGVVSHADPTSMYVLAMAGEHDLVQLWARLRGAASGLKGNLR